MKKNHILRNLKHFAVLQENRWKKKGMGVVPLKWGAALMYSKYSVLVNIHSVDGTVLVHHGGVEMGQGINTKVCHNLFTTRLLSFKEVFV